ncbi:hypothetical protein CsSME_00046712 [Camellia sinensis var. sinensis]
MGVPQNNAITRKPYLHAYTAHQTNQNRPNRGGCSLSDWSWFRLIDRFRCNLLKSELSIRAPQCAEKDLNRRTGFAGNRDSMSARESIRLN